MLWQPYRGTRSLTLSPGTQTWPFCNFMSSVLHVVCWPVCVCVHVCVCMCVRGLESFRCRMNFAARSFGVGVAEGRAGTSRSMLKSDWLCQVPNNNLQTDLPDSESCSRHFLRGLRLHMYMCIPLMRQSAHEHKQCETYTITPSKTQLCVSWVRFVAFRGKIVGQ
jgi:hypothetical protein